MTDVAELINRARYPITEPGSAALAAQIATLRASLQKTGAAEAPAFLSARGLERCIADAESLASQQYKSVGEGTAYLEEPDPKWSAGSSARDPTALQRRRRCIRSVPRRVAGAALV